MKRVRTPIRLILSAAVLLGLVLSLFPINSSQAAPSVPKIAWSPCYREFGYPFECGTVQVPLDYSNPGVQRSPLQLYACRPGILPTRSAQFSSTPVVRAVQGWIPLIRRSYIYTEEVRHRFDLVGFDPRGIARSTALRCFGNPKQWEAYFTPFSFPITPEEADYGKRPTVTSTMPAPSAEIRSLTTCLPPILLAIWICFARLLAMKC